MRGLFVTGTDTGAGKSVLSACLLAAARAQGERVRAHKPVLTGLAEPEGSWPADHELLAMVCDQRAEEVAPIRFGPAVSPHFAAELAGSELRPAGLLARARASEDGGTFLVVEGVGGLLVPLAGTFAVRDLAAALGLPVIIAARPGLGTINHTLLSLEAARTAGLEVRAVVLTPWPRRPSVLERSNRRTIARLGQVEVATLPPVAQPTRDALAEAGAELPWRRWAEPAIHAADLRASVRPGA